MELAKFKAVALLLILALCVGLVATVAHDHGDHDHGGTLCAVCVTIATGVLAITITALAVVASSDDRHPVTVRVFAPTSLRLLSVRAQRAPPAL